MIPIPLPKTNQDRILRAQKLMSFDPSRAVKLAQRGVHDFDTLLKTTLKEFDLDESRAASFDGLTDPV